jgi:ribosomal protein S18 acetylase RimI-like enzyme
VLVNTECDNVAALTLYRRMGFITQPSSLVVLERTRETCN